MDDKNLESEAELVAAHEAYERVQRIEQMARALLPPLQVGEHRDGQTSEVSQGDIHISLCYSPVVPEKQRHEYGQSVRVIVQRMLSRGASLSGRPADSDTPITIELSFGPEKAYVMNMDSRRLWEKDKPLPPGSHGDVLEILHAICAVLEQEWVARIRRNVESAQERVHDQLATLVAIRQSFAPGRRVGELSG